MRRKIIFSAVVAAALALVAGLGWLTFGLNDERTQLVLHNSYGRVESGTRLGVTVGDNWSKADAILQARFGLRNPFWMTEDDNPQGTARGDTPVLVGATRVAYRDHSWRNGVVTLRLQDGRVTEIVWHYPGPFYIDL